MKVKFDGTHNLRETNQDNCGTTELNVVQEITLSNTERYYADEIAAQPGQTRYFKCSLHCSAGANFSTTCPSPPPPPGVRLYLENFNLTQQEFLDVGAPLIYDNVFVRGLGEAEKVLVTLKSDDGARRLQGTVTLYGIHGFEEDIMLNGDSMFARNGDKLRIQLIAGSQSLRLGIKVHF